MNKMKKVQDAEISAFANSSDGLQGLYNQSFLEKREIISDKYHLAKIMFFFFGLGGWSLGNTLLALLDYYDSRFKPEYTPSFVFGFIFCWPLFLGNFLSLYLSKKVSLKIRLNVSFAMVLVFSLGMILFTEFLDKSTAWYLSLM